VSDQTGSVTPDASAPASQAEQAAVGAQVHASPADDERRAGGPHREPQAALPAGSGRATAIAVVALLIAAAAGAAAYQLWQRGDVVAREAARRLQQGDERVAQLDGQLRQAQELVRELQGRSAVLESRLADALGQQSQLEQMYRRITQESLSSVLAEVENAVAIASQQLVVSGNVRGALIALQDADGRLRRIDQPETLGLRRLIAADIERLKAVPVVDPVGLALRLDSIAAGLNELPMLAAVSPAPPEPARPTPEGVGEAAAFSLARLASTGWQGWEALLAELAQLFRVRRVDAPEALLLAPDQQYFVRENLRLTLLSARLALLARSETLFRADLARAIDWLDRYYDPRSRAVVNAMAALRQLQGSTIAAELPSLGDTLAAVRAARAARETNP